MHLDPIALPRFLRDLKKLPPKARDEVREQVARLLEEPLLGEQKVGDIAFIRVHKFKVKAQLYLLAYNVNEDEGRLYLYSIGTHQNFYRDLKKYL